MRFGLILVLLLALLAGNTVTCRADSGVDVQLGDTLMQGGVMIATAPAGSTVRVDGRPVRVSKDGQFLVGAGRDAEGSIQVVIDRPGSSRTTHGVAIATRNYAIQRINGLPAGKVDPAKQDQARIEADWIALTAAKSVDSDELGFVKAAVWPVVGPISGVFGSQRILNGKPKSPHRGVDVAAPTGMPVKAMLDGVVTVAAGDMYYTGGTVMIDHGHGLHSVYAHLSELSVEVGQRLRLGEELGKVGATGRATGPHLHLGLYWFETALDPALILGSMPAETQ